METIWSLASINQRTEICEELKDVEIQLNKDQYEKRLLSVTP